MTNQVRDKILLDMKGVSAYTWVNYWGFVV